MLPLNTLLGDCAVIDRGVHIEPQIPRISRNPRNFTKILGRFLDRDQGEIRSKIDHTKDLPIFTVVSKKRAQIAAQKGKIKKFFYFQEHFTRCPKDILWSFLITIKY
jgi:hypothetical protein